MTKLHSAYEPDRHGETIPVDVRAACPADAKAIASVDEALTDAAFEWLEPRVRGSLERIAGGDVPEYVCVAYVEGEIAGYGKCKFMDWSKKDENTDLPDAWYLSGIMVLRPHRRRGIGRALTLHRIAWLSDRTNVIYYFTGEQNRPSLDLHAALGFEEVRRGLVFFLPPPFSDDELHILGRMDLV